MTAEHCRLTVADKQTVADGVVQLDLVADGTQLPAWEAGAHIDLHLGGFVPTMAYVDDLAGTAGAVTIYPEDEVGRIPLGELLADVRPGTKIFCCGPPPLLDAVSEQCEHWESGSLHVERFVPKDVDKQNDRAFEVRLAGSGTSYVVPADRSILDVLDDAGVSVATSCRVGTCGTCEAVVVDGVPEHRDSVLTPEEHEEGRYMILCVSRSRTTTLTLDL